MSPDLANLQFFVSSSTPILLILMSLLYTANSTSTNTTEGIVKFIIGVVVLVVLPHMYSKTCVPKGPKNTGLHGLDCLGGTSSSFSVTFFIIVIVMLVSTYFRGRIM